ncbi:MAG: YihY/virulence factor BrkB family protein [Verrucomicrobiota bacterium]
MNSASEETEAEENRSSGWRVSPKAYVRRANTLFGKEIWELEHLGRPTSRGRIYLFLRVLTLTWQGLRRNKIPVQAAALTFYSLIGIGPLIALGIMISGFALDKGNEDIVVGAITKAIAFAAPQIMLSEDSEDAPQVAPEMMELINNFSTAAQSGTVGAIGLITLFIIGLQVLSSIESSFNSLWGVDQGRKLGERIVVYWTFISLGAVLGTIALTLKLLETVIGSIKRFPGLGEFLGFVEQLPFGGQLFIFISSLVTFLMLTFLFAAFFRFIPNTRVAWRPAMTGAALVVIMLHLYNKLSFLYVQRVIDTNSLYGSVGIIVILMLGLYVFWLLILLGGQVTYAVQNADFLTNENAWQKTSERTREVLSLAVLLLVAKRFESGNQPIRSSELYQQLRVPSHILNSSVNRLCALGYLYVVQSSNVDSDRDRSFQPGRPLGEITLAEFKHDFECFGNNEGSDIVGETFAGVRTYLKDVVSLSESTSAKLKIQDLMDVSPRLEN